MADNNEDQLSIDMAKLTEQVNKLITALGTVTKDSTDSLVQMKKQIQLCTTELLNMESVAGGNNTALNGLRGQVGEATKKFNEIMAGDNKNTKILTELSDAADDTGEKIGELLKNEKMGLGLTNDLNKNISAAVNQNKSTTQLVVEIIKNKNSVDNKNIPSSALELKNKKSEKPTDANILTPNKDALTGLYTQLNEATKKLISNDNITGKALENITNGVNDTADEIGELLKTAKTGVGFAKTTNDNTSTLVNQNKTAAQLAAEAAREAKKSGSSSATELTRDTSSSESKKDKSDGEGKGLLVILKELVFSLRTSLYTVAGILAGFVTGAVKLYGNFFMTIFDGLKAFTVRISSVGASISGFAKKFATGLFGAEGGLFRPLIDLLKSGMKAIENFMGFSDFYKIVIKEGLIAKLVKFSQGVGDFFAVFGKMIAKPFISFGKDLGEIFGPIGKKLMGFYKELDSFVQFVSKPLAGLGTKISNMFSGVGRLFGGGAAAIEGAEVGVGFFAKTLSKIGQFFSGEKIIGIFNKAFAFGETIASKIPFLAIIPTAIDTIVSAFKKFDTEGMKGVFKSIIVGLLKGLAAFFTLGLSDLIIDFEKLYTAISKPLDGFFDQVMGIVKIFGDIFNWMIGTLTQLWDGFLKPIVMSLYEDALKPIIDTLGALADVAFKVVAIIFKLLTPVFAIIKFIFKVLFEVVKLIWDYVVWPILSILVPVFKVVFSVIGFLFNTMKIGFEAMSEAFQFILDGIDPAIANITAFFDDATDAFDYLGQVVDDFMKPLVDMFGSLGKMLADVWSNIVGKFTPLLSFLGIEIGSTSSNSGMSASPSTAMSASAVASSPKEMKSTVSSAAGGSPVITQVTHAPTTNNVVSGGGGGGSTVILSPTPVRHADSTRHMIGH
jgi:hypothetical protein